MDVFKDEAAILAADAVEDCFAGVSGEVKHKVSHLITVSCTGLYAPGLDIDLIERLGLNPRVHRIGINYMGCYC